MYERLVSYMVGAGLIFVICSTRENIALNKQAEQSSTLHYSNYFWHASLSTDGNNGFNLTCRCCSGTNDNITKRNWWEVDLQMPYDIGRIDVYGRNDSSKVQLQGFNIFISNCSKTRTNRNLIYHDSDTSEDQYVSRKGHYTISVGEIRGQYVSVSLNNTANLVICELQVFTACPDGHFEPDCAPCNCGGGPCYKSNGFCFECPAGSYGVSCLPCGQCLYGNKSCDRVTGQCPGGCSAGIDGPTCHDECKRQSFGPSCSKTCHCINGSDCDHVVGTCNVGLCNPGWQGLSCDQEKQALPVLQQRKNQDCSDNVGLVIAVAVLAVICAAETAWVAVLLSILRNKRLKDINRREDAKPLSDKSNDSELVKVTVDSSNLPGTSDNIYQPVEEGGDASVDILPEYQGMCFGDKEKAYSMLSTEKRPIINEASDSADVHVYSNMANT